MAMLTTNEILLYVLLAILSTVASYRKQVHAAITTFLVERPEFHTWKILGKSCGTTEHDLRQQIQVTNVSVNEAMHLARPVQADFRTWRVLGIRHGITEHDLRQQIQGTNVSVNGDMHDARPVQESDIKKISLAAYTSRYLCATITTRRKPSLPNYKVDDDFHGITPLYAPDNAQVDIVALSGLGGHAVGSFKPRGGWEIWLRDFLPEDVPAARIVVYGYNTTLINSRSKSSIGDLAKSFLVALKTFRTQTATTQRPLVFIGHSLGGLLIKEAIALAQCDSDDNVSSDLYRSTSAFAFFGVPNLGLRYETLIDIVGTQPNESLVGGLMVDRDGEPSSYLNELKRKFVQTCHGQNPKLQIVSFYERQETKTVQKSANGHLERTGPPRLLVTSASAGDIGFEDNFFRHFPLDKDHSDLVKFVESDQAYRDVSLQLQNLVNQAPERIRRRYTAVPDISEEIKQIDQLVFQSLAFAEMHNRRVNVEPRHRNTCEWILRLDVFKRWTSGSQDLLWIKGKPGVGKSTVMAFIHSQLEKTSSKHSNKSSDINLDFFFNARGVELEHTFCGMLRSLLHQLVEKDASTRRRIGVVVNEKATYFGSSRNSWTWQLSKLKLLLVEQIIATARDRAITIFVDALDEAGAESARAMAKYFHELNEQTGAAQLPVKICISCRHYPIVSSKKTSLDIVVEEHNTQDINTFIHDELCLDQVAGLDATHYAAWQTLESELAGRARGVFQWVCLVLPLVQKDIDEGKSPQQISKRLHTIPPELNDVYKYILKDVINVEDRALSFWLFQWVCLAARPLTVTEMRYAMVIEDHDLITTDVQMELQLKSLAGGLLELMDAKYDKDHQEMIYPKTAPYVQISHQSVGDFMLKGGLAFLATLSAVGSDISPSLPNDHNSRAIISGCHARLYHTCLRYLSSDDVLGYQHETFKRTAMYSRQKLPFIDYATVNLFHHAEKAGEPRYITLTGEASTLEWIMPLWIKYYRVLHRYAKDCPAEGTLPIHTASRANMADMIRHLLAEGCNVNIRDGRDQTTLHHAVQRGHESITDVLLGANADVNAVASTGKTPLVYAAERGNISIVKRLLEHDAYIRFTSELAGGALYAAAYDGHISLVQLFLAGGADVNAQGGFNGNALQAASARGCDKVVQILLAVGADVNAQGGYFGNALQAASFGGYDKIVQILLDVGADVNAQGGYCDNRLDARGYDKIVQTLLEARADINIKGGDSGKALRAALYCGYDKVVQILLAVGERHGKALEAASCPGHEQVVQLLLETGTDVNAQRGATGNALQAASYRGHDKIVQMLLDAGADVNAQVGAYGNTLQVASYRGHEKVVQILLDAGADFNAEGPWGNALQAALRCCNHEVVRLLRKYGATDTHGKSDGEDDDIGIKLGLTVK